MTTCNKLLLIVICFMISACGTIRMRYQALASEPNGNVKAIHMEKSYPVGGAFEPLCYLTAIFAGGVCWFYMVMPTVDQKQEMRTDARILIQKKLSIELPQLKEEKVELASWENGETLFNGETIQDK